MVLFHNVAIRIGSIFARNKKIDKRNYEQRGEHDGHDLEQGNRTRANNDLNDRNIY